ncbi:glycoside hydrolase family 3 protein [Streptomyces luteireticuli]|uniref:glycoside hydrolase family 3 protein n=1 Tax=Streptomyces luteireticuli TaxID=173858 RepID=UPI0035574DC8
MRGRMFHARPWRYTTVLSAGSVLVALAQPFPAHPPETAAAPYRDARLPVERRVDDLLGRMTLEEKAGQMTQATRGTVDPDAITRLGLGALLSAAGTAPTPNTPAAWADMVDAYQRRALATRLHIPLLYATDSVHGDNNLLGATVFPHNIAMGATRDPALVRQAARITATETRASGPQWVLGPCLCVVRDDRWGRTYESYGEDPRLVESMETAVDGLQGTNTKDLARPDHVLATAKHFAGDGDTAYGTSTTKDFTIDQGVTVTDHPHFERVDLAPYRSAVRRHHVGSVMASYSSVGWTDRADRRPVRMSAHKELLAGVLKRRMGFPGILVSDWEAIHQLPGDPATRVRTAVNAGIDMLMEGADAARTVPAVVTEVRAGRIPLARVDDAVRRILRAKFQLGLFEHPFTDRRNARTIGSAAHRALARRAVAESQVLLKNDRHALPLRPSQRLYVAGSNADDLGDQAGGWTLTWQGASGHTIPGTSILRGIRRHARHVTYSADASAPMRGHDVGIVVIGETPYAEGEGDVGNHGRSLNLSARDRAAVDRVCTAVPTCVVLDVAGRPQIVTRELRRAAAFVMAWLPGSEGEGVADVLFGKRPFTGKLPVSWPRSQAQEPVNVGDRHYDPLFRYGYGLTTSSRTGRPPSRTGR